MQHEKDQQLTSEKEQSWTSSSLNDIKMLRNDEVLCIDHMQSFRDHANFNNLNVHVTSNLHADEKIK